MTDTPPASDSIETKRRELATLAYQQAAKTGRAELKVIINPTKDQQLSGLTSFASWQNPDLKAAILRAFAINPEKERLLQVEVNSDGITVRLETVPS